MLTTVHHLVGAAEIARIFDVGRQRADAMTRHSTFPAPVADLKAGRIWRTEDIYQWAAMRGRTIHWRPEDDHDPVT